MKFNIAISTLTLLPLLTGSAAATSLSGTQPIADTLLIRPVVVTETASTRGRPVIHTERVPASISIITNWEIERRQEQSLLPLLTEQVPSLFITSRGVMGYGVSTGSAGGITLRGIGGAPTTGLLMLIDGHPQYAGLMGHPLADSYQALMAESVEVVRGPASVLYGSNAMGGVINITTPQEKEDGVQTRVRTQYGSYNTLSTEASNAVRAGKFSSYVALGYNRSDGHRENMEFEQYTGYAKLGYDFSDHWKSYVDLDLTKYISSNPGPTYAPMLDNDMNILRGAASFSLQNDYEKTSGALNFYYNFGYHKINDGYAVGGTPRTNRFRSRDNMMGATLYQRYRFFEGNQVTFGVDYYHFGGHAWTQYLNGDPNYDQARESINEVAGYIDFYQELSEKISLDAGVRFDHHAVTGNTWIPQFAVNYHPAANTTLKAMVGKGFRNPTIRELFMFGIRNPELEPESLVSYELALTQYFLNRNLQLGLNLYYIDGKNSILVVEGGNMWTNSGKIDNYGLELSGVYRLNRNLSVNANYSYLHMKNKVEGAPEHKFYVGADYDLNRWTFSTGVMFVHNLYKDRDDPALKETFTLWNARVSYRATRWLTVFARGENLLAQKYEINDGYVMPRATAFAGVNLRF